MARPVVQRAEDAAARLEIEQALLHAVTNLAEPYRTTIVLRFYDELSTSEIARHHDVSIKTVQTRLRRAIAQLRGKLDHLARENHDGCALALASLAAGRSSRGVAANLTMAGVITVASKFALVLLGFVLGTGTTLIFVGPDESPRRSVSASTDSLVVPEKRPASAHSGSGVRVSQEQRARENGAVSPDDYLERINSAASVGAALLVAREIAALPPARGRATMQAIYSEIEGEAKRTEILKAFATGAGHRFALDILDLAISDQEPAVRGAAFGLLRQFAFRDFQENPEGYRAWRDATEGVPLDKVLAMGAQDFVERMRNLEGAALGKELRTLSRPPNRAVGQCVGASLAVVLTEARLPEVVARWIGTPMSQRGSSEYEREREIRRAAWAWLTAARPSERYLKEYVAPILDEIERRQVVEIMPALQVLGTTRADWVFESLVSALLNSSHEASRRGVGYSNSIRFGLGMALAEQADKRAIPWMIGAIVADDDYSTVYGLGYFGLGKLTGVRYVESHNGAWWLAWWDRNQHDLPEPVRALDPRGLARQMGR